MQVENANLIQLLESTSTEHAADTRPLFTEEQRSRYAAIIGSEDAAIIRRRIARQKRVIADIDRRLADHSERTAYAAKYGTEMAARFENDLHDNGTNALWLIGLCEDRLTALEHASSKGNGGRKGPDRPKGFDGLKQKHVDLSRYLDSARLSQRQYDCLSLNQEYRLGVSEIAFRLGLHHKTVQEHIKRAKESLERQGATLRAAARAAIKQKY